MDKKNSKKLSLWEWVKAISVLLLVGVASYKIYVTPFNITVDFPTLLSLLLALFSVGLAALFYFKATETSNTFYDNSYNFTKDIAQLLVKIESGFGERLRHLDEGYSSMRDYLQSMPERKSEEVVETTKKKIKDEKQEIEKVASERNQIIKHLVERSQLQQEEKTKVLEELKEKEQELMEAQKELTKMNRRLVVERMKRARGSSRDRGFVGFTKSRVLPELGVERILEGSPISIRKRFDRISGDLPRAYLDDLEKEGYFDNGLTSEGVLFIRSLADEESA